MQAAHLRLCLHTGESASSAMVDNEASSDKSTNFVSESQNKLKGSVPYSVAKIYRYILHELCWEL